MRCLRDLNVGKGIWIFGCFGGLDEWEEVFLLEMEFFIINHIQ